MPASRSGNLGLLLACYICLEIPQCWLGYGSDPDTYRVLDSARSTWSLHQPGTSRPPGYWLYEVVTYLLDRAGGYGLTNGLSALCGAIVLILLWRRVRNVSAGYLLALAMVATPVFAICASSAIDYVVSLACLWLFVEAAERGWLVSGILAGALAIGVRGANAPLVLVAAGTILTISPRQQRARLLTLAAGSMVVGLVFYLPGYFHAGKSLVFLKPDLGAAAMWTPRMRLGRFAYKVMLLWGPIAPLLIFIFLSRFALGKHWQQLGEESRHFCTIGLAIAAANAALFLLFPLQVAYLLPAAAFLLAVLGMMWAALPFRWFPWAMLVSAALQCVMTFTFVRPNIHGYATSASLTFAVDAGTLVKDVRERNLFRGCSTLACWELRDQQAHGNLAPKR